MKKITLREELERIHTITYGKTKVLKEDFIDKILGKVDNNDKQKIDEPKKADLVTSNVDEFFNSLENASSTGLSQKSYGGMSYQKEVESMQIGLMLLGYDLPRYGVDGLFGSETASAVMNFKQDYLPEQLSEASMVNLSSLNSQNVTTDNDKTKSDSINKNLLDDIDKASKMAGVSVKITTAVSGHSQKTKGTNNISRHVSGDAVDISRINDKPVISNREDTNKFVNALKSLGYVVNKESGHKKAVLTYGFEGHDNHVHVSNKEGSTGEVSQISGGSDTKTNATPEMLDKLIELLKNRGIQPEELNKYIDVVATGGGGEFTDLDLTTEEGYTKYATISQKFIDSRKPNPLNITGEMMANAARNSFIRFKRFVPAELALAQLAVEGGIGNGDVSSRPIRTKNPFNVGNVDSGANKYEIGVEQGIQSYYDLIAKNYLGKGKSAKDLIKNFVNKEDERYASGTDYENALNQVISQVNKITRSL
jgi:peptidoglycan hydrolase-like protein with peptidoglycan-binding domain